jgi:hypothetical protein
MRLQHFIMVNATLLVSVFAAGCSKNPSKPPKFSATFSGANTNAVLGPATPSESVIPAGTINIIGIELSRFLPLYSDIADSQIDVGQLGKLPHVIIRFTNTNDVSRSEAVQLLDKVLYDQAGIIATHSDAKHVQFKYRSSGSEK